MRRFWTIAVLALPLLGLAGSAAWHAWGLSGAAEWRIPVTGYDPRTFWPDIMRNSAMTGRSREQPRIAAALAVSFAWRTGVAWWWRASRQGQQNAPIVSIR